MSNKERLLGNMTDIESSKASKTETNEKVEESSNFAWLFTPGNFGMYNITR